MNQTAYKIIYGERNIKLGSPSRCPAQLTNIAAQLCVIVHLIPKRKSQKLQAKHHQQKKAITSARKLSTAQASHTYANPTATLPAEERSDSTETNQPMPLAKDLPTGP